MELIVDTHAHFGVEENKIKQQLNRTEGSLVRELLDDIKKLKEAVGMGKSVINDKNLLEDYIKVMELNNISISWIHQLSFENILGYEVLSNEQISKAIEKYPGKFKGFASVNPNNEKESVKELEIAINGLGLHGLKLNPNDYGGFYLNDQKKLYPLYEKCCELNIPLSVHTGITPGSIFRMKHNNPILVDDIAVDFPELTIIVEHMGHPWNDLCYNMVGRHKNMYVTVTAVANILIHTKPNIFIMELLKMISQFGSEKILWGSDWTATPNVTEVLEFIKNMHIPEPMKYITGVNEVNKRDIENIIGLNAMKILK